MLLTFEEINNIKPVSINNKKKIIQLIKEVEELELDKLLGTAFYQDIANNPSQYNALINGSTFENNNGYNITHKGLKNVLAYLVIAEYVMFSYVEDTFTGMVTKKRPDSEQVSVGVLKNLRLKNREIAFGYWEKVKEFLTCNYSDYPLWNCNVEKRVNNFNFFGVKNTLR